MNATLWNVYLDTMNKTYKLFIFFCMILIKMSVYTPKPLLSASSFFLTMLQVLAQLMFQTYDYF